MKLILLSLLSVLFTSLMFASVHKPKKDPKMCKLFTDKAVKYQKTMRNDEYAAVTLMPYKKRAKLYCPDIKKDGEIKK